MRMSLPSRVLMTLLNPVSASLTEMSKLTIRSSPRLSNTLSPFSLNTIMTSPCSSPGCWSPSPLNVTFWPDFIPAKILRNYSCENIASLFLLKYCEFVPAKILRVYSCKNIARLFLQKYCEFIPAKILRVYSCKNIASLFLLKYCEFVPAKILRVCFCKNITNLFLMVDTRSHDLKDCSCETKFFY